MDSWLKKLVDGLKPDLCIMCGTYSHRNIDLCTGCERDLPRLHCACSRCGLALPNRIKDDQQTPDMRPICLQRRTHRLPWTHLYARFRYDRPLDRLIPIFKTHGRLSHGKVLSKLLARYWLGTSPTLPDMFVPVALYKSRLRQRGFNQALEIAYVLSDHTSLPCRPGICRRIQGTPSQKQLSRRERLANLPDAFRAETLTQSPHITVVGDVVTTGATISALVGCLLNAGTGQVDVIVIARRPRGKS